MVTFLTMVSREFPEITTDLLQLIKHVKHGITVEISPYDPDRTRPQENYYRKWCREFGKFTGDTPDEMHNHILCICYGSVTTKTLTAFRHRPVKRSSGASRIEYGELIETLIRTAAEMGFVVPPPQRDIN